jgi:hypothetical protein
MGLGAAAPTTPYTPQSGAFWLPQTANPSASMVPFYSAPTGFATGASTSSSIPHALPSAHGRNNGDVITGNILINPFLQ